MTRRIIDARHRAAINHVAIRAARALHQLVNFAVRKAERGLPRLCSLNPIPHRSFLKRTLLGAPNIAWERSTRFWVIPLVLWEITQYFVFMSTHQQFLDEIETFLEAEKMAPTKFGLDRKSVV